MFASRYFSFVSTCRRGFST